MLLWSTDVQLCVMINTSDPLLLFLFSFLTEATWQVSCGTGGTGLWHVFPIPHPTLPCKFSKSSSFGEAHIKIYAIFSMKF